MYSQCHFIVFLQTACLLFLYHVSLTVRSYFSYLSSSAYLGKQLDEYMKKLPKVRIIRLKERQGLIRARLEGAAVAKGRTQLYLQAFSRKGVGKSGDVR
jgi:hypothetical protein